jgi:hypothetical protein
MCCRLKKTQNLDSDQHHLRPNDSQGVFWLKNILKSANLYSEQAAILARVIHVMILQVRSETHKKFNNLLRFEVYTAVTMKNGVFWDVTPCGSCENRRFGGT